MRAFSLLLALLLPCLMAMTSVANDHCGQKGSSEVKPVVNIEIGKLTVAKAVMLTEMRGDKDGFERSGCCSHHQGVCGCSFGRAVCCDSTYSPSCGCD